MATGELVELELDTDFLKATLAPIMHLLEDESINEVKISPLKKDIGAVWYYKHGSWEEALDKHGMPLIMLNKKIEQVIGYMAGANKKPAHDKKPVVECVVPLLGYRFTGILQPMAVGCSKFNIRKFSTKFYTFEDYAAQGGFDEEYIPILHNWANNIGAHERHDKFSIAIFGTTNTGKTTFTNAFINEKRKHKPKENWVVMEDTRELIISSGCVDRLQTTEYIDMNDLLITSLRLTPDNVVIGEVRAGEAAYVAESAMISNTLFTMHAKNFDSAISRFERMMLKNPDVDKVDRKDLANIKGWISLQNVPKFHQDEKGNVIRSFKRQMTEMVEVSGYDADADRWEKTTIL